MSTQVDQISISNFKRIEKLDLPLKAITALVGGNTSGKSSALQAAQLLVALLRASFIRINRNGTAEFSRTLSNDAVAYRPTENLLELKRGDEATQTSGFTISFVCTTTDEDETTTTSIELEVTRGKNANLAIRRSGDDELAELIGGSDDLFSIFTPGLSGISRREEWRTRGALDAAAMHGDANLYLRTVLDHLLHKDLSDEQIDAWWNNGGDIDDLPENSDWKLFSQLFDGCYPGARIYIEHNQKLQRYVEVTVSYQDAYVTLDMASTGMLQVVQILAYACLYRPPLLLLDEPDAHLHADSQSRLYEALHGLTLRTNTRVLFATHSPQIIQLLMYDPDASIVWMNDGQTVSIDAGKLPAVPLLMELGALTLGADAFNPQNKTILLTEDTKSEPVRVLASANGWKNFACLSYHGAGNLTGARQLARLLSDLRPDAKILIHRDRDFRTDGEIAFETATFKGWCEEQNISRVAEIFTPGNDVEHSFCDQDHLEEVFKESLDHDQIKGIIEDVVASARDEMTGRIRIARTAIDNTLYASERLRKKPEWEKCGLKAKPPKHSTFMPESGKHALLPEQCYGKGLLNLLAIRIHHELGGQLQGVYGSIYSQTKALEAEGWKLD